MSIPEPNSIQNSRIPRMNLVLPSQDRTRRSSIDSSLSSPNINLQDRMDAQGGWFAKSECCVGLDLQYTNRPSSSIKVRPDGNNSVSNSNFQPTNINWDDYTNGVWKLGKLCSCEYCTSKLTRIKGDVSSTRLFVGEHDMAGALAYTMNYLRPGKRLIATDLVIL